MRRYADCLERCKDMLRDSVVDHALAADRAALLRVERGRIVLEILDQGAGLRTLVEDLGLTLINLAAADHRESGAPTKQEGAGAIGEPSLVRKVSCDAEADTTGPI